MFRLDYWNWGKIETLTPLLLSRAGMFNHGNKHCSVLFLGRDRGGRNVRKYDPRVESAQHIVIEID